MKHAGKEFGIEKYSTVSSIVERVKYGMKTDKGLKNLIQDMAEKITKSQRQTLSHGSPKMNLLLTLFITSRKNLLTTMI